MVTPVRPDRLRYHLEAIGYDSDIVEYLCHGFTHGFSIEHQGDLHQTEPPNNSSVDQNIEVTEKLLQVELLAGRLAGPYDQPPFANFHVSPLKLVPKSKNPESPTFRLVHNLSHPFRGDSVNSGIPDSKKKVHYATILDAIHLIVALPNPVFTAKTDIAHAYRIIPISPSDYFKLGLKFKGKYYFDRTLPPGAGSACQIFETFSTALHAIHKFYAQSQNSIHMLDDFLFIASHASMCQSTMNLFDAICDDIAVPIAPHKRTSPSRNTVFLGIELDTARGMAILPQDKVRSYAASVQLTMEASKVTRTQLESLVGKLSFASLVVPARAFLRRLIDLLCTAKHPHHRIRITREVRKDLQTWLSFLSSYNGRTYFRMLGTVDSPVLHMYSDASKQGFGATFGSSWIQAAFPVRWQHMLTDSDIHISFLELYPVLVLLTMFGHKIQNANILFHSDNEGVVSVLNKQSSKDPLLMSLIRPLVLTLIGFNINLKLEHIPGLENVLSDAISRFQITPRLLAEHAMHPTSTPIPSHLLPHNFEIE